MADLLGEKLSQVEQIRKNTAEGVLYSSQAARKMEDLASRVYATASSSSSGERAAYVLKDAASEMESIASSLSEAASQMETYINTLQNA